MCRPTDYPPFGTEEREPDVTTEKTTETIDITPTWQGLLPYLVAIVRDGETDTARKAGEDELRQMAKVADLMVAASKDPAVLVVREVQRVCRGLVLRLDVLDDDPATATYEGLVLVRKPDDGEYVVWRWGVRDGKAMLWSGGYWPTREEATYDYEDRP